jgi:predicted DNA-binding WGR domain protein
MNWTDPPANFQYVLFDRTNPEQNEYRYYYIAWLPLLFGQAMVRIYGRRGQTQRELATYFDSLEEAWPEIRKHIKRRLNHGYRVVGPVEYRDGEA